MTAIAPLLGLIVEPITNYFTKRSEQKAVEKQLDTKLALARQDSANAVQLTDAEWELLSKRGEAGTWKDEFITVTFMMPIWLIFIGSIHAAFAKDNRLLDGVIAGINAMKELGLNWGELTFLVVIAGLSLKMLRDRK